MASPLLDIPGARRRRAPQRPSDGPGYRIAPRAASAPGWSGVHLPTKPGHAAGWRRARRIGAAATVLLIGLVCWWSWKATWVRTTLSPESAGLAFPSSAAPDRQLVFDVSPASAAGRAKVTLAGVAVADVVADGGRLLVHVPRGLPEGGYELAVRIDRRFPFPTEVARWPVVVDDKPPALAAPGPLNPVPIHAPLTITGTVEPGSRVVVEGGTQAPTSVTVADGTYRLDYAFPPADAVQVTAVDEAGNRSQTTFHVPVSYPAGSRAVHVTAAGWGNPSIRADVLALVDAKLVNAVQLDLKDEEGIVGYDSAVPFAGQIGAVQGEYRIAEAVQQLHGRGARVIGRVVAFRDPVLANWAWANGHRDWALQTPDGNRLSDYGGFTNYVQPAVRDYNLAIAEEAARAGVDDILWDYVRRPEGDPSEMVVPGLTGTSTTTGQVIAQFMAEGQARLRPLGVYQGASLFGIAATRPENIGQPVPDIARHVDYVAPMVYPSHYVKGECGVADPVRQPYDIVKCSLGDFARAVAGTGAVLVPWLQDFTLGSNRYGAAQVRDQIRAAQDAGAVGFLLWNPTSSYTRPGLE